MHPDDAYMLGLSDGHKESEHEYKPWVADLQAELAEIKGSHKQALTLLAELVDTEDCWFDHHGGCQAHGYLSLEQGEKCPQFEVKELLKW